MYIQKRKKHLDKHLNFISLLFVDKEIPFKYNEIV